MHDAVKEFIQELKKKYPQKFLTQSVLEFGSLNINGTPREFFKECDYTGIDWREGKDVDIVCKAHEYKPGRRFSVIISTEMLEHDKFAAESVLKMVDLLKSNGLLIITCASLDRKEHEAECGIDNFYKNISSEELLNWLIIYQFKEIYIEDTGKDIRFYGVKK